jgi:hydrogenase maturation protein HypF
MGTDKGIWGGELLRVDGERFDRLGHLRELALPGGDKAAREPWRMAAAALFALGRGGEIKERFPQQRAAGAVAMMLGGNAHTPPTSELRPLVRRRGGTRQRARGRRLRRPGGDALRKSPSAQHGEGGELMEGRFVLGDDGTLDLLPLLAALADERTPASPPALFHATLAEALAAWVQRAAEDSGLRRVRSAAAASSTAS